jgi:hypothetical protein
MITDDNLKQAVYQHLLNANRRRLEQAIPGSARETFADLSLAESLNMLFLLKGEWGSLGDYVTTQRALRALLGDDLMWAEPKKPTPASLELIH